MDLAAIRSNFSHLDRWIFLNHAGVSPLPRPAVEAMRSVLDDVARNAGANEPKWAHREAELRRNLARILNCDASEVAFVKNTSEGISIVSNGIDEVETRLIELTDRLCARLVERGCRVFSPRAEGEKSGIVCFDHSPCNTMPALLSTAALIVTTAVPYDPPFCETA
jgi:kynureninase